MIKKFEVTITPYKLKRMVHMYLPDDYDNSEKRYPVIYMYDGHNLFSDSDATYGRSWRLADYLNKSKDQYIVVGVECNHEGNMRMTEYFPYQHCNSKWGSFDGTGKKYMDWLTTELKPYIDQNYRTLPERENTMIAGSSMGGLMSFYSIINYNHIFSKAACLSSSIFLCYEELFKDIKNKDIKSDTRIYLDYGTRECGKEEMNGLIYLHQTMVQMLAPKTTNVTLNLVKNAKHNEKAWEKRIPVFMDYLWKKES